MIVAVTGHRPHKLGNEYDGSGPYSSAIRKFLTEEVKKHQATKLVTGMALGVDMIFAEVAISLSLPFLAALPCVGQERMWPKSSQDKYRSLLTHPLCEVYNVTNSTYNNRCMQERNEWMVNNCDFLIAIWNGTRGGTKNCVDYAESVKRRIMVANPERLIEQ